MTGNVGEIGGQASTHEGGGEDAALLSVVIQTAPDAIITIDETGVILSFNPAAERIFGFAEAEVAGRNVACLMPAPHRDRHDGYIARYLRTGEKRIIGIGRDVEARRKSGEVFAAELAVGELKSDGRHVFTGFVRDVSARVAAERSARHLRKSLERMSRIMMLGEMSSALGHEIAQPLAAIASFADAAQLRTVGAEPDLDRLRADVGMIAEQSLRAGEILRRMRDLVARGRAQVRPEPINEIIEEAVRLDNLLDAHIGPRLVLDLAPGLPRVLADRIQIQQVILNLLHNAVEALTGEEGAVVAIGSEPLSSGDVVHLRAGANDGEVMVTVSDNGPGLSEPLYETLFDPLVTTKRTGAGIGLAICRTIIAGHGGRIWAENAPEGGARIHFTLPVAPG